MPAAPQTRPRVLIADFEPMVQVGMGQVLKDGGVEVVARADGAGSLLEDALRERPDAVVLGLDPGHPRELPALVRDAVPTTKVIVWSGDESEMQVFDPGAVTPRWIRPAARDALVREIVPSAEASTEE